MEALTIAPKRPQIGAAVMNPWERSLRLKCSPTIIRPHFLRAIWQVNLGEGRLRVPCNECRFGRIIELDDDVGPVVLGEFQ